MQWAVIHPAESVAECETLTWQGEDTGIPVAGPGAPLVAEFAIAELAAAVGLGPEAGKRLVGEAVETRYRLERLWKRVVDGDLSVWKARRIAERTMHLSEEAADFVDQHVARVAHKVKPSQVDRLVTVAIARFMPEQAEEDRRKAWDQTQLDVDFDTVGIAGTCLVAGEVDLADAIDLDHAVRVEARRQADLGSTRKLDQRRALALGVIARRDPFLELPTSGPATPGPPARVPRSVVLHVHLAEAAFAGSGAGPVGWIENTRTRSRPTTRTWCGNPDVALIVKPVRDLAEHVHVEQYEVPDRIAEVVALRDVTCVFRWCTRPARKLKPDDHSADCDHNVSYAEGGPTCSCQLASLCRRHHRLKTHGGWRYLILEHGTYVWSQPVRRPVPPRPHRHPRCVPRQSPLPTRRRGHLTTKPRTRPHPTGGRQARAIAGLGPRPAQRRLVRMTSRWVARVIAT